MLRNSITSCLLFAVGALIGCGQTATVMPSGDLTDAQKAAVKAEDEAIAMEESQGKLPKPKAKSK